MAIAKRYKPSLELARQHDFMMGAHAYAHEAEKFLEIVNVIAKQDVTHGYPSKTQWERIVTLNNKIRANYNGWVDEG